MNLEERVREYYTLFNEGNVKKLQAMFENVNLVVDFKGMEHHGTGVVRMFELYPKGCQFEPVTIQVDGTAVFVTVRLTGGPAGRASEGQDWFVFYGDKIRSLTNTLPLAVQADTA